MANEAVLSNSREYTFFSFGDVVIRFRTSSKLNKYTKILEWDNGNIVVMALYDGLGEIEEYIDLPPILEELYMDSDDFLKSIKKVRIAND